MEDDSQRETLPASRDLPNAPTARDSAYDLDLDITALPDAAYEYGALIGRGGMGEIIAVRDGRIGRNIALKRMHGDPAPAALRRFLREARIQARLDHPAIVPVHELGTDAEGRMYFTMKHVAGVTLAQRLVEDAPTLRLLRALVDVCQAIELAHARGVVHRDLKPANIMLGPYGEVYVLDWGVARLVREGNPETASAIGTDIDTYRDGTATGALLGTPGYMAPEQVKGLVATTAADVYAVGAILFEILAREPLHPRGPEALAHTLTAPRVLPSSRRQDIPPELDALCGDTLAEEPARRPSIHEVAERLQSYLDGDRDVEQRRALARTQVEAAREALRCDDRGLALRAAGRAIALDPGSTDASDILTKLLVEPPAVLPPAIEERVVKAERAATLARINKAAFAFTSPVFLAVGLPFLNVRGWGWLLSFYAVLVMTGVVSLWHGRRTGRTPLAFLMVSLLLATVLWSRLAGPLMLTPAMICGVLIALASHPRLVHHRWRLLGWGLIATLLPIALELAGILPSTISGTDQGLLTRSTVFAEDPANYAAFVVANTVFVLVVGFYASHQGLAAATLERRLQIQEWHLDQLVPVRERS